MLIFDQFPSQQHAAEFAEAVRHTFTRNTILCASQEESDRHDPFPFELTPPIVLVERDADGSREDEIRAAVKRFHGQFAGT